MTSRPGSGPNLPEPRPSASQRELGPCPICDRPMIAGGSVDRHHFVPRSRGGRASEFVHRICHRKLHSLWSEAELEQRFSDAADIRAHPEMQRFIRWLTRKPPEFYVRTNTPADPRQRRRCRKLSR